MTEQTILELDDLDPRDAEDEPTDWDLDERDAYLEDPDESDPTETLLGADE